MLVSYLQIFSLATLILSNCSFRWWYFLYTWTNFKFVWRMMLWLMAIHSRGIMMSETLSYYWLHKLLCLKCSTYFLCFWLKGPDEKDWRNHGYETIYIYISVYLHTIVEGLWEQGVWIYSACEALELRWYNYTTASNFVTEWSYLLKYVFLKYMSW